MRTSSSYRDRSLPIPSSKVARTFLDPDQFAVRSPSACFTGSTPCTLRRKRILLTKLCASPSIAPGLSVIAHIGCDRQRAPRIRTVNDATHKQPSTNPRSSLKQPSSNIQETNKEHTRELQEIDNKPIRDFKECLNSI